MAWLEASSAGMKEIPTSDCQTAGLSYSEKIRIKKLEDYLRKPIVVPKIRTEFMHLKGINISALPNSRPENDDFSDDAWMNKSGITLERYDDEAIAALGRVIIPMINSGFSRQGAACIFVLAYHLKRPGYGFGPNYMFDNIEDLENITDKKFLEFSEVIDGVIPDQLAAAGLVRKEAAVYAFLAASMLRLFTRSVENFVANWQRIQGGFKIFFKEPIDIAIPQATNAAVQGLKDWFSLAPHAKVTLYRLLYTGNASDEDYNMRKFLYDMHLVNTGLHVLSMFVQICILANADTILVLSCLNNPENRKAVKGLATAIKLMKTSEEKYKRGIWRYAVLFDDTFLSSIRTKNCPRLVYILGSILKRESPANNEGILQIAQLGNLSDQVKRTCVDEGKRLMATIREFVQKTAEEKGRRKESTYTLSQFKTNLIEIQADKVPH